MSAEREPDPPRDAPEGNPTSDELDVEGPNESAPGHEPSSDGEETEADSASETAGRP